MFELIVHNAESRFGSFQTILHLPQLITTSPIHRSSHSHKLTQQQHLPTEYLPTPLTLPLSNVPSSNITRPNPGLLGPWLCRSSTDRDLTSAYANIHRHPRDSPSQEHPRRQDSLAPLRHPTMFIWSRPSRDSTSISGNQYDPVYNLCPMLHHHLRH